MAEAQFDLCFDSDWDSSGSTKDPNYDPKSDDDLGSDVAVEEESMKKKKFTKKRKKAPEDDPASGGDNPRKLQSIRLENQYPYCNQLPGQFYPSVPQFPMYQMPGFNQQMLLDFKLLSLCRQLHKI